MNYPARLSATSIFEGTRQAWAFRVASAPEVGGGHMRRCLALADALASHARIVFVLDREGAEVWAPAVTAAGLEWAAAGDEPAGAWSGCVIDSYQFGLQEFAAWRKRAGHVVVIDDFGLAPCDADLVVSPGQSEFVRERMGAAVLTGPQYAMLDKVFAQPPVRAPSDRVEEIFVCFGLRDSAGATGVALEALLILAGRGFAPKITVALGSGAPALERVEAQIEKLTKRARLVIDADNVRQFLDSADLAVGAGGVGLYERMASGVPSVTVSVAENQRPGARKAADAAATVFLADAADVTPAALAKTIGDLASDLHGRERLAECGRRLVDGRGAERVARKILALHPCK